MLFKFIWYGICPLKGKRKDEKMKNILLISFIALLSGCYTTFTRVDIYSEQSDAKTEVYAGSGIVYYDDYPMDYYSGWRSPYRYYIAYYPSPYPFYPYGPGICGFYGGDYYDGYYFQPYSYNRYGYKFRHYGGGNYGNYYNPPGKTRDYAARSFGKRKQLPVTVSTSPQKPGTIRRRSPLPTSNTGSGTTTYSPPTTKNHNSRSTVKVTRRRSQPKPTVRTVKSSSVTNTTRTRSTTSGSNKVTTTKSGNTSSKSSKNSKIRRRR